MFHYDPDTGFITNKISRTNRRAGERAESVDAIGYLCVHAAGRNLKAHRVAWYLHYGKEPGEYIDHIDGNKKNNRISNLRDAPHAMNMRNRSVSSHSASGIKGVHRRRDNGMWRAFISVNHRRKNLGQFATRREATDAVSRARRTLHGDFARD